MSVAVAFRIRSESGTQFLWVNPTIPHTREHLYRFLEMSLRFSRKMGERRLRLPGTTTLTFCLDNTASNEKNAVAIRPKPIHIHETRNARRTTPTSAAGRKSFTSPTAFMARETHNSPPVPAQITRK